MTTIDWARVARPCDDEYDTRIVLELAKSRGYKRRCGSSVTRAMCDGQIRLEESGVGFPEPYVYFAQDHPHIVRCEQLLRVWPCGYRQVKALVDSVMPFHDPHQNDENFMGSVCGPGGFGFGSIAVTFNSAVGAAEGIVHEMAHHKLRALGVGVEGRSALLDNQPDELYPSPIRYDCLRPMSAVIHAQYSYTYIAALGNHLCLSGGDEELTRQVSRWSLAIIVPKLIFGVAIIRDHARGAGGGQAFLQDLVEWCDEVIRTSSSILENCGVSVGKFTHPIAE